VFAAITATLVAVVDQSSVEHLHANNYVGLFQVQWSVDFVLCNRLRGDCFIRNLK